MKAVMKSRFFVWPVAVLFLCAGMNTGAEEIRLQDAAGKTVVLGGPATRIVSLAPHVSELLFEIGAEENLVGAVEFSNYPEAAKRTPRVGDYKNIDTETLLALKPDLVIGWLSGNRSTVVDQILRLGVPVFLTEPRRLEDIPKLMRDLGLLTNRRSRAEKTALHFEEELRSIRDSRLEGDPVTVFYQAWGTPLVTLSDSHLVSDAIRLCGGKNIFGESPMLAPTVSVEAVLAANPQVILTGGVGEARNQWLDEWKLWPHLQAVRYEQLYLIDPDLLQRPTSRILSGIRILCSHLDSARKAFSG